MVCAKVFDTNDDDDTGGKDSTDTVGIVLR